jgi:hypothetical protein
VRPAWVSATWCKSTNHPERREDLDKDKGVRRKVVELPDREVSDNPNEESEGSRLSKLPLERKRTFVRHDRKEEVARNTEIQNPFRNVVV